MKATLLIQKALNSLSDRLKGNMRDDVLKGVNGQLYGSDIFDHSVHPCK